MKTTKLFLLLASISALVVSSDGSVLAAESHTNLGVSVNVANNCTITTVAVAFPDYDPIVTHAVSPDNSNAGSLTITCNKGAGTSISLGYGLSPSPADQPRMMNDTNPLSYKLYSDSPGGTVWSGVTRTIAAAPSKAPQLFPVYGQIPGGQDAVSGTYNDTVVATVNF